MAEMAHESIESSKAQRKQLRKGISGIPELQGNPKRVKSYSKSLKKRIKSQREALNETNKALVALKKEDNVNFGEKILSKKVKDLEYSGNLESEIQNLKLFSKDFDVTLPTSSYDEQAFFFAISHLYKNHEARLAAYAAILFEDGYSTIETLIGRGDVIETACHYAELGAGGCDITDNKKAELLKEMREASPADFQELNQKRNEHMYRTVVERAEDGKLFASVGLKHAEYLKEKLQDSDRDVVIFVHEGSFLNVSMYDPSGKIGSRNFDECIEFAKYFTKELYSYLKK